MLLAKNAITQVGPWKTFVHARRQMSQVSQMTLERLGLGLRLLVGPLACLGGVEEASSGGTGGGAYMCLSMNIGEGIGGPTLHGRLYSPQ